jgi:hypothetical protein
MLPALGARCHEGTSTSAHCTFGPVRSELFEALRAADPTVPEALETFDRIVASDEPHPDLYEHSVRIGHRSSPHRLTYYFDTHARGEAAARVAGQRFVRLSEALGLTLPPALSAFVQSELPEADEVLQVVLGVEAPVNAGVLGKYYLVFRANPAKCVGELLRAVGLAAPSGTDPGKVYIVGVDLTAAGVFDVKHYYRLEPDRLAQAVDNAQAAAGLLPTTGDVVFQQCTRRPERRQVYLHTKSTVSLSSWLARHGFDEAIARARMINAHLSGSRIEARIVSFAYEERRLQLGAGCVYFHLARI